jgi:hypothetical protein
MPRGRTLWGPTWARLPFMTGASTATTGAWPSPPSQPRPGLAQSFQARLRGIHESRHPSWPLAEMSKLAGKKAADRGSARFWGRDALIFLLQDDAQDARIGREMLPLLLAGKRGLLSRRQMQFEYGQRFAEPRGSQSDDPMEPELMCHLPDALTTSVVARVGLQIGEGETDCGLVVSVAKIENGGQRDFDRQKLSRTDGFARHPFHVINEVPVSLDND